MSYDWPMAWHGICKLTTRAIKLNSIFSKQPICKGEITKLTQCSLKTCPMICKLDLVTALSSLSHIDTTELPNRDSWNFWWLLVFLINRHHFYRWGWLLIVCAPDVTWYSSNKKTLQWLRKKNRLYTFRLNCAFFILII